MIRSTTRYVRSLALGGPVVLLMLAAAADTGAQAPPPTCQSRALRTIQAARLKAASEEKAEAERLLKEADSQCGTSYAVLKGISEVYEQLGNATLAAIYAQNSERYAAPRSSVETSPGRAGGAPGAAGRGAERSAERSIVREKFALVVGVGQFASEKIRTLKYAKKDASDFAALLTDPNIGRFRRENVTLLTDEQATMLGIRTALADIARKALKDDLVILYFSTHGSSPTGEGTSAGAGFLVTYDANVQNLYGTAYGMDELANFMRQRMQAERIVTFLDTCYSGDTTRILKQERGSKGLEVVDALSERSIGQIAQGKGSVVITSSGSRELSWESDELQNSFFTVQLIDSLRARKGLGNIRQLYSDIQRKIPLAVKDYTRKKGLGDEGKGATQTPSIYPTSNIPDIVIGTPVE